MEQELRRWLHCCLVFGIYLYPPGHDCNELKIVPATCRKRTHWLTSSCSGRRLFLLQLLYICLITMAICALYVHALQGCGSYPTLFLSWFTTVILFSFQVLANFLIIMEAVFRRPQHAAFLLLLEEIEIAFKLRLRQDVRKPALLRNLYYLIGCFGALSLLALSLFMVTSLWLNFVGFFWYGLWSILTMRVRIIQLLVYVRILRHYLECLCVKLQQIVAYRMAPQQCVLDINYARLASLEYLLAIKEIYALIFGAFELLNYFAGWSLFAIIICYMFDITCNIYWMQMSLNRFPNRRYYYIAGPLVIIPLAAVIGHLCYLCDKCKELGYSVRYLINKIKMLGSSRCSMPPYRLVLHQFSAQLQLQRIEVTAQHFFTLELRLLAKIVNVTATIFIILVQFLLLWLDWNGGNVLRSGTLKIVGWFNSTV